MPLLAGGAYTLGTVTFSVSGGRLTVSVWTEPSADCAVESASVQVALSAVEAQQLGTASFHGLSGALNAPIQLGGAPYAAVCLRMKVSFTPAGLPGCSTAMLSGQDVLWQQLLLYTSGQAVG